MIQSTSLMTQPSSSSPSPSSNSKKKLLTTNSSSSLPETSSTSTTNTKVTMITSPLSSPSLHDAKNNSSNTNNCPSSEPTRSSNTNNKKKLCGSGGGGGGRIMTMGGARQKRNSWMRGSVVRRAASIVDEEVAALCEKSPFLNSVQQQQQQQQAAAAASEEKEEGNDGIAFFHRLEVHLGKVLGRGGFAEVYSVAGFDVSDDDDDDPKSRRRRECQRKVIASSSSSSSPPPYAIKFLRKKLLNNTREFQHAAIDMAVESKYLAALCHPNIIKIRGLTAGGISNAFRSGKHDDFFIIMDQMEETLEERIQRWRRHNKHDHEHHEQQQQQQGRRRRSSSSKDDDDRLPRQYFHRTLDYANQIADALSYLHEKEIVYRDLKPQNLGFRERDTIQLFDFGLCRELPKPKGQCDRAENLEDEETFHMSGVGTQRYCAPEILNTRIYNLKADVYSWSMVALEMLTWKKPFAEYSPEEHQKYVAGMGERPTLTVVASADGEDQQQEQQQQQQQLDDSSKKEALAVINVQDWPSGMADLLQECWTQDVGSRLTMQSVLQRMGTILAFEKEAGATAVTVQDDSNRLDNNNIGDTPQEGKETEVVLEFPSHFSPRHPLLARHRQDKQQQQPIQMTRDDSDAWFGDRQSDASTSYQELTMTSTSTTMHDSNSTR